MTLLQYFDEASRLYGCILFDGEDNTVFSLAVFTAEKQEKDSETEERGNYRKTGDYEDAGNSYHTFM
jgi:hypothetical protein